MPLYCSEVFNDFSQPTAMTTTTTTTTITITTVQTQVIRVNYKCFVSFLQTNVLPHKCSAPQMFWSAGAFPFQREPLCEPLGFQCSASS